MRAVINRSVVTIDVDQTALDAARLMQRSETGCLLVVDNDRLVGILTGRDLVLKGMTTDRPASEIVVRDVMSRSPTTVDEDDLDPHSLARVLGRARVRRLPIVDAEHRPVGIVALEDLLLYNADISHSLGSAISSYLTVARLKTAGLKR